jgi:hypothetical protein
MANSKSPPRAVSTKPPFRKLEAQIHARGAEVKEDVTRRRDGVMLAADLTERMQLFWSRHPKE